MKGQVMTRRQVTRLIHLSPLCLAVVLAACGASADDELEQWMQQARSTVSTRLAPLPEPKPYAPREYTTTKQTDPFSVQKVAELSRAQNESPEPGHRREPLEDYPLEAFKLLGTMKRNGESEAVLSVGTRRSTCMWGSTSDKTMAASSASAIRNSPCVSWCAKARPNGKKK